jgi:hypothetical protein
MGGFVLPPSWPWLNAQNGFTHSPYHVRIASLDVEPFRLDHHPAQDARHVEFIDATDRAPGREEGSPGAMLPF